jgi:hypothetical protein
VIVGIIVVVAVVVAEIVVARGDKRQRCVPLLLVYLVTMKPRSLFGGPAVRAQSPLHLSCPASVSPYRRSALPAVDREYNLVVAGYQDDCEQNGSPD